MEQQTKSFTLIELLVVIAVIGLLSSIVLVSLKGARDKARLATGLQFSQSVLHSLGSEAVGIWDFEEGAGNIVSDRSGNGNNGTWQGTGIHWAANDISQLGTAGQFNGISDYVDLPDISDLNLFGGSAGGLTFSAWAKVSNVERYNIMCRGCGPMHYISFGTTGSPRMLSMVKKTDGVTNFWPFSNPVLKADSWTHVVFVFEGQKGYKYFINGKLEGSEDRSDIMLYDYGGSTIGKGNDANSYFNGLLDEVRVFKSALTAAEIQKLYVEGLKRHMVISNQ